MHQTCTGTKKTTSFELQSAPNLHRDKKNKKTNEFPSSTSKAKVPKHGAISSLNNVCFVPVEVWCDSWFAIESLFCLGRELNAIEGHVVLNDNGFILNRASFIRKLFWNKVYFIINERNL